MSVTVSEIYTRSSTQGPDWRRTYVRTWQAITSAPTIGSKTVRESCPVSIGNSFDDGDGTDTGAYVQSIEARCVADDGKGWEITATYGPYDPTTNPQNPMERPVQVSWSYAAFEKALDKDADGVDVLNSASEPFDPPIPVDDDRLILTVVRCEQYFDPVLADLYKNSLNDAVWLGADPGTIKLKPITAVLKKDQDVGYFYEVTYIFERDRDGWNKPVRDQGVNELVTVSGVVKRRPILTATGVPVQDPVPLDGNGAALAVGQPVVYRDFKRFPLRDFNALNFTEVDFPNTVWG